jgi:hypothetical protein
MKATKDGYAAFMKNKPGDISMADQAGARVSSVGSLNQAMTNGH